MQQPLRQKLRQLVLRKLLVLPLAMIAAAALPLLLGPTPHSYATGPHYVQGPPIKCLDVSLSDSWGQGTVYVSSPPGGGVEYSLQLYVTVTNVCPKNYLVSGIQVESPVTITCPGGSNSQNPGPIVFNGPYGLNPGGGYGKTYTVIDKCVVLENGVPTKSVVPTHISRTVWAQGSTVNGNVRQTVTSNSTSFSVW